MPAAVKTPQDEAHWREAKEAVREQYTDVEEDSDKFWRLTMHIYQNKKAVRSLDRCLRTAMQKALVRGHYIVVNGKRVWVREHERVDRVDTTEAGPGEPGVSTGTPPKFGEHEQPEPQEQEEEGGEETPQEPLMEIPAQEDPSATALPGTGPQPTKPPRHDSPVQTLLATAIDLPVQAITLSGPLEAAAFFCYLRGSPYPKLLGLFMEGTRLIAPVVLTVGAVTRIPPPCLAAAREALRQEAQDCWLVYAQGEEPARCSAPVCVMTAVARRTLALDGTELRGTVCLGMDGGVIVNPFGTTRQRWPYPEEDETEAAWPVTLPDAAAVATFGCQLLRGCTPQTWLFVLGRSGEVQAAVPVAGNEPQADAAVVMQHSGEAAVLVTDQPHVLPSLVYARRLCTILETMQIPLLDALQVHGGSMTMPTWESFYRYLDPVASVRKARALEGRCVWQGLNISIENRVGSIRRGIDPDGQPWESVMLCPYGYIRGTEGSDGEQVDVFLGPLQESAREVYCITIKSPPDFTQDDEQKCMIGFPSALAAKEALLAHYDDPRFFGSMQAMSIAEFVAKVRGTADAPGLVKGGYAWARS